MNKKMWLIGAGPMAVEYGKVLLGLGIEFVTIGRGSKSAERFENALNINVIKGGINEAVNSIDIIPDYAIVSVSVDQLKNTAVKLIKIGVKNILVEKPGGLDKSELLEIEYVSMKNNANVFIAYNRRFYSSVNKAKEIINDDGGITSFNFEFTEWSHKIKDIEKSPGVKEKWFLANSTHVVDLAFHLGGKPENITCYTGGSLDWHPTASIFSGAGVSEKGSLFSYQANWTAPGRWSVEVLTKKYRLIFRPLEKLQIQNIGSINFEPVEINDKVDQKYKPGVYMQVNNFINSNLSDLCTISDQINSIDIYNKIAGYNI